jgi:hypothetical protein
MTSSYPPIEIIYDIHNDIISNLKTKENTDLFFFIGETTSIMDDFNKFIINKYNLFFNNENFITESNRIEHLLKQYIDISRKYVSDEIDKILKKYNFTFETMKKSISELSIKNSNSMCSICNINNCMYVSSDGFNECKFCGHINENIEFKYISEYYHTDNINVNRKTIYKESHHFSEVFDNYHGDLKKQIPQNFLWRVKTEIKNKFIGIDETTLSIYDIKNTLKCMKIKNENKYYNYIPFIYNYITNKPLINVRHLKEIIMTDFITILNIWERDIKPSQNNRKSFLNSHYVLYQLLYKNKCFDEMKQIIFLKSKDKIAEHNMLYGKICSILKWDFFEVDCK